MIINPYQVTDVAANEMDIALASWTVTGGTLAGYSGSSPFTDDAEFTEDTGTSLHYVNQAVGVGSLDTTETWVGSCYIKSVDDRQYVRLRLSEVGAASNWFEAIYDLSGASVANTYSNGSGSIGGAGIGDAGGGWFHCWAYGVVGVGATSGIVFNLGGNSNAFGSGRNYTGASKKYAFSGCKLERGTFPTAYEGLGS